VRRIDLFFSTNTGEIRAGLEKARRRDARTISQDVAELEASGDTSLEGSSILIGQSAWSLGCGPLFAGAVESYPSG
jgi:hypothetical protein